MFLYIIIHLIVFLAAFYHNIIRKLYLAAKLPGPRAWPLLGNALIFFNKSSPELLQTLFKLKKDFGTLIRIWIGPELHCIVTDPKDVEVILSSTTELTKSQLYDVIKPWIGEGLLTSDGKKWQSHRKMINPTFHFKILEQYAEVFNRQGDIFVENLKKFSPSDKVELAPMIGLCTLDIICESVMGASVNAQMDKDSSYVKAVKTAAHIMHKRMYDVTLRYDCIFKLREDGRSFKKAVDLLQGFTRNVIQKRREDLLNASAKVAQTTEEDETLGIKKKKDFLALIFEAKKENGEYLTDAEICEEVDTMTVAGQDTTSSAILFALYCIARYPEVQQKCHEEITEVMGDSPRPSTLADLNNLSYLETVIKEAQRYFPPVPIIARHISKELDLNGRLIPANTSMIMSPIMMGRDPKHFPEPDKFMPERFAADRPVSDFNRFAYVPFSSGLRNCIGQKYAMYEIKSLVAKVVGHYHLTLAKDSLIEPILSAELILSSENTINFHLTPRK